MNCRTNEKPEMLIKGTIHKARNFLTKSFTNLKSFTPKKQARAPIFSCSDRINSKLQEFDDIYRSFSEKWDSLEIVKTKVEQGSMTNSDCRGLEGLEEEKAARKENNFLAQKMKDLEMMDLNDRDHVLDVEEVLHYYSHLTCPIFVEIVDRFFMDMYLEFHNPHPSRSVNSSMRKLGLDRIHSSMRSLGPLQL